MIISMGDRVYVVTDLKHIGTAMQRRDDQVLVRWHKGFATWEDIGLLRTTQERANG